MASVSFHVPVAIILLGAGLVACFFGLRLLHTLLAVYGFVAGAWAIPALRRPLPESFRRKAVCVVQGVALLVALGPIIPSAISSFVCAVALAALTWSFAVDVRWLMRPRP